MKIYTILKEARRGFNSNRSYSDTPVTNPPERGEPAELRDDDMEEVVAEFVEEAIFNSPYFTTPLAALETRGGKWDFSSNFMRGLYKKIDANEQLNSYFGNVNALEEVMMFSSDAKSFLDEFNKAPVDTLKKYAFSTDIRFLESRPEVYKRLASTVEDLVQSGEFRPTVFDNREENPNN